VRLPVTVVAGLASPAKSALIEHWRAAAAAPWALIIDRGEDFKFPRQSAETAESLDPGIERIGGCACCTAGAALGAALRKLMRRGPWARLLVDLNGGAHPAAFVDALRTPGLSDALQLTELVSVVDASRLDQRLAGAQRRWLTEQVQSADRVVLAGPAQWPRGEADRLAALLAQLGGLGAFAPAIEVWRAGEPLPLLTVPDSGVTGDATGGGASGGMHGAASDPASGPAGEPRVQWLAMPGDVAGEMTGDRPRWRWLWRASAERRFDRAKLIRCFDPLARTPMIELEAVLRTERDWYRFRDGGCEPALWRRDSRVQIEFHARELPAVREALGGLADQLRACALGP